MKALNSLLVSIVLSGATVAIAADDVTGFSIRGVNPGTSSIQSCDKLSASFGDERSMKDKLGIPRKTSDWTLNVDYQIHAGSESSTNGCIGGYKLYDRKLDGALVRHDHIELKAQNNVVYFIKNSQQLNVGEGISDCTSRREQMVDGLIDKYGKPTINREDQKRGATFVHLVWDYSSQPNLRPGNDRYEEYEAFIQCEMYTHGAEFALMKTQSKIHSGKAIADSRKAVKAQKTFDAEL